MLERFQHVCKGKEGQCSVCSPLAWNAFFLPSPPPHCCCTFYREFFRTGMGRCHPRERAKPFLVSPSRIAGDRAVEFPCTVFPGSFQPTLEMSQSRDREARAQLVGRSPVHGGLDSFCCVLGISLALPSLVDFLHGPLPHQYPAQLCFPRWRSEESTHGGMYGVEDKKRKHICFSYKRFVRLALDTSSRLTSPSRRAFYHIR